MPMKGSFDADFSQLQAEIDKALASLGNLQRGGDATNSTFARFEESIGRFDNTLNAAGVHVMSQVRALHELAGVAGQTVGELGALSTAGLAVGAALGGWKLGRAYAEFVNLDKTIADSTAALMGWGDVAKQQAAAAAEAIAAANMRVVASGRVGNVRDMTDVMIENAGLARQTQMAGAHDSLTDQLKKWAGELALVNQSGQLKNLEADIRSQAFSAKELADAYGISEGALRRFTEATKNHRGPAQQAIKDMQDEIAWARAGDKMREENDAKIEAHKQKWAQLRAELAMVERSYTGVTAGLMGLNAEMQKFTQSGFEKFLASDKLDAEAKARNAAARGLAPGVRPGEFLPTDLANNPYVALQRDMLALDKEVQELLKAGQARVVAEGAVANRRDEAMNKFTGSLLEAAKANDAWIASLRPTAPGIGPSINPWSTLNPKPIEVKPIGVAYAEERAAATPSNVNVNVSGVWDPATVSRLYDAISEEAIRRTGRLL